MDLFATPGNPIPPDPIVSAVRTDDGLTLRVVRWVSPPRESRGTVVVAMGRSEFVEQYFEVVGELLERRFDVVLMDWRGQGQSDREIARPRRGHVKSFDVYQHDLAALEAQILRPFAPKPWFGLGHSMGAAILLAQAHAGRCPFDRLLLSAPMIDLPLVFRQTIERLSSLAVALGLGRRLVPGGSEDSIFRQGFEGNRLTSDIRRFDRSARINRSARDLPVGAPTMGWLNAAFRAMRKFQNPRFAMEINVPILIVAAGADSIVDTAATERFTARLKVGRCLTIAHARHQIMMESDSLREQFWAAFDAFIPGHDDAMARRARQAVLVA